MRISDWSSDVCSSDLREFAVLFGEALGQPVVVVNAGGGHGVPALNQVLGAPADGYTLLMPASGNMTVPSKEIGRASCRERVCSVRVDLGGRRIIKKKHKIRIMKQTQPNNRNK